MQSVVPLLLDGNMSPERLDPFGSRDRKMSSYLLEEDDGREERTGYLYLELKRQNSDTYLTIGMGIRARRGKNLDKWYFSLTDGRRIGKDFFLYKDSGEKVTLSKKELENRIGDGGRVIDRQVDYMEYVNRQIFGFETEEYKNRLKQVRKWYLKGYMGDNILENTSTITEMIRNGEAFAETVKNKPGMKMQESLKCEREMEIVQFGQPAISYNSMAAFPWMITKNSISPELSMKLLNLFYSDEDIMNLLAYGIEGIDYVETEDGHIRAPEGKKGNPYYGGSWRLPNQFITKVWEGNPLNVWDQVKQYNEDALHSCEIGFNFNVFPVAQKYLKLQEIYDSYEPILESGLVNPENGLKQMLEELKQNGLDEVIAEKRRQFESWKKQQE